MKHVSIKLLLALCALITSFTGCSLLNEPDQVTNRYSSIETTAYSTNIEYSSVRTYKETVYALVNRYDATTNSLYHSVIKLENNNSETLFEMVNGENTYASDLCVVSENEFILTMNIFDEDQPDKCKITRYSEKGIATDEFTLPGHCKAISDDEGTLYIIGEDDEGKPFFAVTDSDSQIKIQQNIDLQSLNDGVVTSDGSVVLVGTNSYGDKQLKRWDESKKEIVDYPIGDSDTDYQTLIQSHSNDFLFYFTSYDFAFIWLIVIKNIHRQNKFIL